MTFREYWNASYDWPKDSDHSNYMLVMSQAFLDWTDLITDIEKALKINDQIQ